MNNLKILIDKSLDQTTYEELAKACNTALEKISELGPADNDLILVVKQVGTQFSVNLKMAATGLMFTLQSLAQSPFMALEDCMRDALTQIEKWSLLKNVETGEGGT